MVVDRPFLFAIVHTATGLPLFLGQLSHPGSGPAPPAQRQSGPVG
jgi:serine protease inhibitor